MHLGSKSGLCSKKGCCLSQGLQKSQVVKRAVKGWQSGLVLWSKHQREPSLDCRCVLCLILVGKERDQVLHRWDVISIPLGKPYF